MGRVPRGRFELLAELPSGEVGTRGDSFGAEVGGDAQAGDRVMRVGTDHHDGWRGRSLGAGAGTREGEGDPVEPESEADAGRGLAAHELDQAVIAAAAAHGVLRSLGPGA